MNRNRRDGDTRAGQWLILTVSGVCPNEPTQSVLRRFERGWWRLPTTADDRHPGPFLAQS